MQETRAEEHWWRHARCFHRLRRLSSVATATTYVRSVLGDATWEPARVRLNRLLAELPRP